MMPTESSAMDDTSNSSLAKYYSSKIVELREVRFLFLFVAIGKCSLQQDNCGGFSPNFACCCAILFCCELAVILLFQRRCKGANRICSV